MSVKASTHGDINVDDISILKLPTAGHKHKEKMNGAYRKTLIFLMVYNFFIIIQLIVDITIIPHLLNIQHISIFCIIIISSIIYFDLFW